MALKRARILLARSRIRSVPTSAPLQLARRLARSAATDEAAVRRGFELLASAQRLQDEGRGLVREHKLRSSLTQAERKLLFAGQRPTRAQRALAEGLGIGAPAVLAINDEYLRLVRAQLENQLREAVRLRVTAELSGFAAHERQRPSTTVRLGKISTSAATADGEVRSAFSALYRVLRKSRATDAEVTAAARLLADTGRQAARDLAPLAVGLDDWAVPGGMRLRYHGDHAAASLAVGSTIRAALLASTVGLYAQALFESGMSDLTDPWRQAARSRPQGAKSELDAARGAAGSQGTRRIRGIVESIDDLQVNKLKRVSLLRVRSGPRTSSTVALPFFNPRYVGIKTGTIVDLSVLWHDDVLAEYSTRGTSRKIAALTERFKGTAGGVADRRNLEDEADTSWIVWLVRAVRPMYDALPNSINGNWSLGSWFTLSVVAGTLY